MSIRLTLLAAARSSSLLEVRFGDDRPLDATGWHEAERAAPALLHLAAADLRYCSPSPRCRETGRILGLSPLAQPALRGCDMGRWHGRTLEEVMAHEPRAVDTWLANPRAVPHGGESLLTFISRVGAWLDTRQAGNDGHILAVAEPDVVRAALVYALKAPPHSYWSVDITPLTAMTLARRAGRWNLLLKGVLEEI
ncbi:histidine phosphatase family protein [Streptomyces sp. 7N604]|uniref:histidine phosphatase family protein n=1 Tax=Streptomyces sp. 7N604 TaxID=3457415 RepID=UPI003FCFDA60